LEAGRKRKSGKEILRSLRSRRRPKGPIPSPLLERGKETESLSLPPREEKEKKSHEKE